MTRKPFTSRLAIERARHEETWGVAMSGLPGSKRFFITVRGRGPTVTPPPVDPGDPDPPPPVGPGNASFRIELNTQLAASQDFIAPYGFFIRPVDIVGFAVQEPPGDTNVYDPTQHEIYWSWDFGDPGYQPFVTANIPNAWRDPNRAYVKYPAHVYDKPGSYTINCYAFDLQGNWATAQFVFGTNGNAPAIADPEAFFAGASTCYWSQDGIFPSPLPSGAVTATTQAEVNAWRSAQNAANNNLVRLALRCNEVYEDIDPFPGGSSGRGLHIVSYGTGAQPEIRQYTKPGPIRITNSTRGNVIRNIAFIGPWDARTETGRQFDAVAQTDGKKLVFHRCKFSGWSGISTANNGINDFERIFSDTEVTNWQNYGMIQYATKTAIIGCDFHQATDALAGIDQGTGSSNPYNLGNRHGCWRSNNYRVCYVAVSSFYNCSGWSTRAPNDWISTPPTAGQPTCRFSVGAVDYRAHHAFERTTHEATGDLMRYATFGNSNVLPRNHLWDSNILCATGASSAFFSCDSPGFTFRNNLILRFNTPLAFQNGPRRVRLGLRGPSTGLETTPSRAYNNTMVFLGPQSTSGTDPIEWISVSTSLPGGQENNIFYGPLLSPARGTGEGGDPDYRPFITENIAGFVPRYPGPRWNFPPINFAAARGAAGMTIGERREDPLNPGTLAPGDVANGEAVILPYPNYAGVCNGAGNVFGGPLTKAFVEVNSTQKHTFTIPVDGLRHMGDTSIWPHANGLVEIRFETGFIRVRNLSGVTWTSTRRFVMMPDLSDYLMPVMSIYANPTFMPAFRPDTGSDAIAAATTGYRVPRDFFQTPLPLHPQYQGSREHGPVGAFSPVPA